METTFSKWKVGFLLLVYAKISWTISDPTASGNTLHLISLAPEDSEVPAVPLHLSSPITALKANNSLLCARGLHALYSSNWYGNDSSSSLLKLMVSPTAHEEECIGEAQSSVLVPQVKSHRFLGHWDFLKPSFQLFQEANFTGAPVLNWTNTTGNNMMLFPEGVKLGSIVITGKQFKYILSADGDVMKPNNSICVDVSKFRGPGIYYLGSTKQNLDTNLRINHKANPNSTLDPVIWPNMITAVMRIPGESTDFHVCNVYVTVPTNKNHVSETQDVNDKDNENVDKVTRSPSSSNSGNVYTTSQSIFTGAGLLNVISKIIFSPLRWLNSLKDMIDSGVRSFVSMLIQLSSTKQIIKEDSRQSYTNGRTVTAREKPIRRVFDNDDDLDQLGPKELKRLLKLKEKLYEGPEE